MVPRKWVAIALVCFTFVVAEGALARQAAAGERLTTRPAIYRTVASRPVTAQPVAWYYWGPSSYGQASYVPAPYSRVGNYCYQPVGAFPAYAGGWAGVYPPVTFPPSPGAYWAYGYPQYSFGAYYGW